MFYRQGISVELYAKANWFTPADVEAPAIEYVSFSSSRSYKQLKIAEIDPILYSEVMRDVDMTVSIASLVASTQRQETQRKNSAQPLSSVLPS